MLLLKELEHGITVEEEPQISSCVPCIEVKIKTKTFPKRCSRRSQEKLELVHSDLCCPMKDCSWRGAHYLLTFTDDFSRKSFGYLLKNENQTFKMFLEFKALVENQTGLKIKSLGSDNGGEFCNKTFDDFLAKNGIIHETTVPYSPQQNGVAERLNRTAIEKARPVLQGTGSGQRYWGEATVTAIYLKNSSPTVAEKDATPEEIWSGSKVDLSHL
jgi:transposase InsO family protein